MATRSLNDQFYNAAVLSIVEDDGGQSESVVDGVNILARAAGQFFIYGGKSNNNRFYSKKLWENAISRTREKIDNGQMLGTIGHTQKLDDQALLEGKVSHRISKLWLGEDGKGMGEILVLNTTAGKQLNAYLRGGVKFPVSSRAEGKYNGQTTEGVPRVDEEAYILEGFDFVRNQGIEGAIPQLVESIEEPEDNRFDLLTEKYEDILSRTNNVQEAVDHITEVLNKEQLTMGENTTIAESLAAQKLELEQSLDEALTANTKLNNDKAVLEDRLDTVNESIQEYKQIGTPLEISEILQKGEELVTAKEQIVELKKTVAKMQDKLESYKELGTITELDQILSVVENTENNIGTPDEIQEALSTSKALIEEYSEYGSPSDIKEALTSYTRLIESHEEIGAIDDIKTQIETLKTYEEIGTIEHISEVLDMVEHYIKLGTVDELTEAVRFLEEYAELGSPADISTLLDKVEEDHERRVEEDRKRDMREFAAGNKVHESVASTLLSKVGDKDEVSRIIESIRNTSDISKRYKVDEEGENINEDQRTKKRKDADTLIPGGTRLSRLMENLSR